MKILVGSVTNAEPAVLQAHLDSIHDQDADAEKQLLYVLDPEASDDTALELARGGCFVVIGDEKPEGAKHQITTHTHEWSQPTFYWLAQEKEKLLQSAREGDYDALWLVDSDLVCGPETLRSLIECDKDVVSAVFWTRWTPKDPPLPQVWLSHPYGLSGMGWSEQEFLEALAERGLLKVRGLGACTLIRREALEKVAFWPLIEGLPEGGMWQGEDRHFCVRAARAHVELWADAWPDIYHCYRPGDETKIPALRGGMNARASDGDLVSLRLEPVEEPHLAEEAHLIRGRLGMMRLLPDIEAAVRSLSVGESTFVNTYFPTWHPIEAYRNEKRVIRVTLLDTKPYAYAPTLRDCFAPDADLPEAIPA